jgi:hypothetical protein
MEDAADMAASLEAGFGAGRNRTSRWKRVWQTEEKEIFSLHDFLHDVHAGEVFPRITRIVQAFAAKNATGGKLVGADGFGRGSAFAL